MVTLYEMQHPAVWKQAQTFQRNLLPISFTKIHGVTVKKITVSIPALVVPRKHLRGSVLCLKWEYS